MKYKNQAGWLSDVRRVPSPHFNSRPDDIDIDLLVIHSISLPPGEYGGAHIDAFFLGHLDMDAHPYFAEIADLEVSAHLLIDRAGRVTQYVPLHQRAWHAGASEYQGRENCNDYSIGIELEGLDTDTFTEPQYQALAEVSTAIIDAYPSIKRQRIVAHSEIAPKRKRDPGPRFDWPYYQRALDACLSSV
ncbi:MAG: 1,6-anhydro-N-acetylmuramyl-L-alanine amidase AmpD [Gammaproteobacteria bacterium]|nr:1,6-anhydro-N-acetylmuramyl-L-alanine amidase AmpD [Gammaproteobacteria bacterium]